MDPVVLAEIALNFGFVPIPLTGKRPLTSRWEQTTPDRALGLVTEWRNRGRCDNVGILCGLPSRIIVVDIDVNKNGVAYWMWLLQQPQNQLPPTFTVRTGSGGYHYYFNFNGPVTQFKNANEAIRGRGIDLKTTGGQVVFAGSTHPETHEKYRVVLDDGFVNGNPIISDIPAWLLRLLEPAQL
jgi:hypothetical protein